MENKNEVEIKGFPKHIVDVIKTYFNTMPKTLINELRQNLKEIENSYYEKWGSGHYHKSEKRITISKGYNIIYFLELLGHEIGHALNVEEKFRNSIPNIRDPHVLCDYFSEWMLYGKGPLKKALDNTYGSRKKEDLKILKEKASEVDKIEREEQEKINKESPGILQTYVPGYHYLSNYNNKKKQN